MVDQYFSLSSTYLDSRRTVLLTLEEELERVLSEWARTEVDVSVESVQQAHEFEDDAQRLEFLETVADLMSRTSDRLSRVRRALAKIDAGTYGFSEVSGKAIPQERLDFLPEATNTTEEEQAEEIARKS